MKGEVNKNSSPPTGDRNEIQPTLRCEVEVFVPQVHGNSESTADLSDAASRVVVVANHGSI
jgi:hypothetical protein